MNILTNITMILVKFGPLYPIFKYHKHIISPNNKTDISYHSFIKDYIFEETEKILPRGNPIGIINYYC